MYSLARHKKEGDRIKVKSKRIERGEKWIETL